MKQVEKYLFTAMACCYCHRVLSLSSLLVLAQTLTSQEAAQRATSVTLEASDRCQRSQGYRGDGVICTYSEARVLNNLSN